MKVETKQNNKGRVAILILDKIDFKTKAICLYRLYMGGYMLYRDIGYMCLYNKRQTRIQQLHL